MAEAKPSSPAGFEICLSADQMTITLSVDAGAKVAAADVVERLKAMHLHSFDEAIVGEAIEKAKLGASRVVVASGTPPVDQRPARIDYLVPVADGTSTTVGKVEAGQLIATMIPATPGTDGRDVFGKPAPHKTSSDAVQIGRNLNVVKNEIISKSKGNLRLNGNVLSVEPLLEIRGDDGNLAPITFDGDAVVKGSLNEGHTLDISGSLTVGGAIEPVQLKTGGSVNVKGGIIGGHKGKYQVGGELRCRFISGGLIIAAGNLSVQSEVNASHIICRGRLTVARGPIFGGVISANGGISCNTLGHPSGTPTIVEAGDTMTCRSIFASEAAQIESNRKRVAEVRAKIAPLMKIMKHLTAQQREKATELLYEADEMEAATEKLVAASQHQLSSLLEAACAEIQVTQLVHPGVKVRFPGIEAVINTAFKGPFTLTVRKGLGRSDIVLIDSTDQSCTVLPSHPIDPSEAERPSHLVGLKAA